MLIGITLMVLIVITIFTLILGNDLIATTINVVVDNTSLVDGTPITYEVPGVDVLFNIDTSTLIVAGIVLIVSIGIIAGVTGIQVLGSGLSPSSVRIIILITSYVGIWSVLSILAFSLIVSIEIFGSVIYISLTLAYVIGVIQKISGSGV